jgi:Fe-S cluster assembly protein SufD
MNVLERLTGSGEYWRNQRIHVVLEESAELHHLCLQQESPTSWHHADLLADITSHAHYRQIFIASGANVARMAADIHLSGEQAQASCHTLYMGAENQQLEQSLHMHHDAKNTRSKQHVRGLLAGKSQGIFYGSITVPEAVTGCAAHQQSKALLLSPEAEADNRPELTILNDQVECSHGAAIGNLDEEALYYLQARGIDKQEATGLMVGAFAHALLEELPETSLRNWLIEQTSPLLEKVSRHDSRR